MEAQACGAFPITTGITALEETQMFGLKVELDKYEQLLASVLAGKTLEPKKVEATRKVMTEWAREQFNWDRVAKSWINELFYGNVKK
jgi:hypothetical protein